MRSTLSRLRLLNVRELVVHKARAVVAVLVMAVSATLLVSVFGTYGSLTGSVDQLARSVSGDATLEVTGITDTGFDESLLPDVRAAPGVATAAPLLQAQVGVGNDRLTLFGVDDSINGIDSNLEVAVREALAQGISPGQVAVGPGLGITRGGQVRFGDRTVTAALVIESSVARRINGGRFVVAPLPVAQDLAGRQGRVDSILVRAADGADPAALSRELTARVGGRAVVAEPRFRTAQASSGIALARDATMMVALIGLVLAAFLVYNSMNMSVAERRVSIARLRALGGRRTVVVRDLLVEAVCYGALGALLGTPLGIVVGRWAIGRLPPFLIQSYNARIEFLLPSYAIPATFAACVLASVASSASAAYQIFRVSPIEALKPTEVAVQDGGKPRFVLVAGVSGVVAMALSAYLMVTLDDRRGLAASTLFVVGVLLFCYSLTRRLARVTAWIAARFGVSGKLAAATVAHAPRRVWATAVTVGISVAVTLSTAGALTNMVDAGTRSLAGLAQADLWVTAGPPDVPPTSVTLPAGLAEKLRQIPGVRSVAPGQLAYANLGDMRVLLQGISPGTHSAVAALMTGEVRQQVLDGDGVTLSRRLSQTLGLGVGDAVVLPTPTGPHRMQILQLTDSLTLDGGLVAMALPDMQRWFERPGETSLDLSLQSGSGAEAAVRQALPPSLWAYTGQESLAAARGATEQVGALAVGIRWIVSVVAGIAMLNTLMLAVLDRRREIGVLRAIGSDRRTTSRMVIAEAAAVGVVGGALGVVFGSMMHYLVDVSLSATTATDIVYEPHAVVVWYVLIAVGLCLLGAVPPAIRAGRLNIIEAIADE